MLKTLEPESWEEWDCSRASRQHRRCGQCTRVQSWIKAIEEPAEKKKVKLSVVLKRKGKLPVFLQEFLWTENCERLLKLLYVEHNHSVYELIRMRDITRLRSESFQWIIQEGRAWPPPTDENMFRYARTRVSKTRNQLSFGVCHLEQVIKSSHFELLTTDWA